MTTTNTRNAMRWAQISIGITISVYIYSTWVTNATVGLTTPNA
ncbi:MAG: hypothetical protein ACK5V5_16090 [Cyclobacteriaceae bacterium]